jgi:hypothetical protein
MTRLIPGVMLFMMIVSLLFIATAAANMAGPGWIYEPGGRVPDYEPGRLPPEPHFSNRYDYYNYVIERIQSHLGYEARIIPYDRLPYDRPGLADGYTSDRLQDLINDIRTRV